MFAKLVSAALLICFSIVWPAQSDAQDPLFVPAPGSPMTVGKGSGEIILADLNRDGHLDILTKHLLQQNVVVRFGNGKGHFAPAAGNPMSFSYQPGAITLADVNHDGILDLVVASKEAGSEFVRIFVGNGKGGFTLASGSPFNTSAAQETYKPIVDFADINEDGKVDLVTGNGRRNSIQIFFGDGKGTFSAGTVVPLEYIPGRHTFAVGDVDGDRHIDLVIAINNESDRGAGRVMIKRGDGRGAFTNPAGAHLSVPPDPRLARLADVNGDQRLDAVLSHSNNQLSILLNMGNCSFKPSTGSPHNIGAEAFGVVAADVNHDKKNDLIAATVNSVTVLLGNNQGFVPAPGSPFKAGPGAYNITVGDINEDGKLDVAASSFEGNSVTVLLGR